MASGMFPLRANSENGEMLIEAAALIGTVINGLYSDVYSGDSGGMQFDNAASDGGSIARLKLAQRLIKEEVL